MVKDTRCDVLKLFVPSLKKEIEKKKEITMSDIGLAIRMGPEGIVTTSYLVPEVRNPTSNYWTAKKCLWNNDIVVDRHKSVIKMRARTPEDKLPTTLIWEK